MKRMKMFQVVLFSLFFPNMVQGSESSPETNTITLEQTNSNQVIKKIEHEINQDSNPFSITAYEQNYLLPFYYTSSPSSIYAAIAPNQQKIKKTEIKFQFSFKTPIWRDFFGQKNVLYLAYTQQSYWQAYVDSPFFRANNYKPEVFLENNVDFPLFCGWNFQLFNVGAMHQSNGRGGEFERSWNRLYMEAIFSKEGWLVSLKPWYVLRESSLKKYNPNIERYLGHGRLLIAYKFRQQVVSLIAHNNFESGFRKGSVQLSYSFPLIKKIRGFIQVFNGYGQNLVEYDNRTSAFGIGISLSDWL